MRLFRPLTVPLLITAALAAAGPAAADTVNGGTLAFNTAKLTTISVAGTLYVQCPVAAAATYCDFTPNTSGTWKATLDPQGAAIGKATLTLVADVNGGTLNVGTTATVPVSAKGQNANFVLPEGTNGTPATLHLTGTTFPSSRLYLFAPAGNTLYDFCDVTPGTTDCTFYPSFAGNWRVSLDPLDASTGTTTITRAS